MFVFENVKYKDILDIPSLTIEEGKVTCFVGKSGSGKTSLLKLLNRMESPDEGKIYFEGKDLDELDPVLHRRRVTMLSQEALIFDGSIRDNLLIGLKFNEMEELSDERLVEVLHELSLFKDLDEDTKSLSGGEKQRLSLARILLLDPDVYLLDEPSSALDEETEDSIIGHIVKLTKDKGKTIIFVSHSNKIARKYSDILVEIADGTSKVIEGGING